MRFRLVLLPLVLLLILLPVAFAGDIDQPVKGGAWTLPAYVPGEVLIKYRAGVGRRARKAHMERLGVAGSHAVGTTGIERVTLPSGTSVEAAVSQYKQDPAVEQVEPNIIYRIVRQPGDPLFSQLWGLYNVGQTVNGAAGTYGADIAASDAWEIQTGSRSVVVAVVDTGVDYNHPDLRENILRDSNNNVAGYDFVDNDTDPMDYNGHGTHVAGTIGATGNNGVGVTGINWQVQLMPLRAFDTAGESTTAWIIAAIDYARDHGAHIINASWGSTVPSDLLKSHIDAFGAAGGLFVTAAGNSGVNNDQSGFYPASFPLANIVAVTATDQSDRLASFANYGTASVHVAAPGTNIDGTVPPREKIVNNTFNGVTFANVGWNRGGTNNTWDVRNNRLTDSVNGYVPGTDSWVTTPSLDLQGYEGCQANFYLSYNIKQGDSLTFYVSTNGAAWSSGDTVLDTYSGSTGGRMVYMEKNLKGFENAGISSLYTGFHLKTSAASPGGGSVSVDEFQVTCASADHTGRLPLYAYFNGTSMATAHATGVAALVKAQNAALTSAQVKEVLMDTVDAKSLPVASGGRINAYRAVSSAALSTTINLTATVVADGRIDLSWSGNWGEVTGFVIERALSPAGPFTAIGTTGANVTSYSDTSAVGGTLYYYRVRAIGTTSSVTSLPSNEATATALGNPSAASDGGGGGGGGCFIATAAFGSPLAAEVQVLRQFRDTHLLTNPGGRLFVTLYYRFSPPVARFIGEHEGLRKAARLFLFPLIYGVRYPLTGLLCALFFLAGVLDAGRRVKRIRLMSCFPRSRRP